MKSIEEARDWLLANRVDKDGDLDLIGLDFSDFNGDVYISRMEVKKDLRQDSQRVKGELYQGYQEVQGGFYSMFNKSKGSIREEPCKIWVEKSK